MSQRFFCNVAVSPPPVCFGRAWSAWNGSGPCSFSRARAWAVPGGSDSTRTNKLWGTEERLRDLFGEGIASLRTTKSDFIFRYRSASHWLDHFGTYYGPMVTTLKALDATRQEQFSHEVISLLESYNRAKDGTLAVPSEYLEAVAIKR